MCFRGSVMDWLLLSLVSGLISAICWLVGDILLLGFNTNNEHKHFFNQTNIQDKQLATTMLSGSTARLRWGALIANFSIPFMLFSLFGLYLLAQPSVWTWLALGLLGIGFSLSPVAHVAFYYVGTLCKSVYENKSIDHANEALINEYSRFLHITWRAAIVVTGLGWLVYSLVILSSQTALPVYFIALTPLVISPLFGLLNAKFRLGSPHLDGAPLNVGLVIFFVATLAVI